VAETDLYVGIDPGGRHCGFFIMFSSGCYFSSTEDFYGLSSDKRDCSVSMHDPVACGLHAASLVRSETGQFLEWMWTVHDIDKTSYAIEVTQEGPTNYWAAGLAAVVCAEYPVGQAWHKQPVVVAAQPRTVKWNYGLPCAGHAENKRNALKTVRQSLGLEVDDDHQADAALIAISSFFPRHRSISVPGVRPGTTKQAPEPLDQYYRRLYSIWQPAAGHSTIPHSTTPSTSGATSTQKSASKYKVATARSTGRSAASPAATRRTSATASPTLANQASSFGGTRFVQPMSAVHRVRASERLKLRSTTTTERLSDPRSPTRPARTPPCSRKRAHDQTPSPSKRQRR
jgi:hypothetical protein